MTRILSHITFVITTVAADVRPGASAWMTEAGLTVATTRNPNALALRHAP